MRKVYMGTYIFLQKDARQFTDLFASPEMSVRVCFEGQTIDIFCLNVR